MEHKRKYHPTCNVISLTITTKIVAFFDMAFGLFGLVWFVLMLSRYDIITLDPFENIESGNNTKVSKFDQWTSPTSSGSHQSDTKQVFATNHKVINLTLVAFYTIVNLSVFVVLLVGVYKRRPGICLVWFHIRCAIFVFKAIILFMYLIGGRPLFSQIPFILSMIAHLYGLWVVNCYVDELRNGELVQRVQEIKEKNDKTLQEPDDIPNGIEAVLKKRLEEGVHNPSFITNENDLDKQKLQQE